VPEEDLPWNDVPADSDVIPGTEEPDPAEVMGDEDDAAKVDISHPPIPDSSEKYRRESLDERLSEEVPDRSLQEQEPQARGVVSASDEGDTDLGELSEDDDWDDDSEAAEEEAVHIVDEDRI
jgi:hypothetical protein